MHKFMYQAMDVTKEQNTKGWTPVVKQTTFRVQQAKQQIERITYD